MSTRQDLPQTWPDALSAPSTSDVAHILDEFWRILAGVPDVYQRSEILLLHTRINALRHQLLYLMLAANGIRYPEQTQNLNLYLGDSQRAALEKTLTLPATHAQPQNASLALRDGIIAQAVALVVIYRWYAPKLAQKYGAYAASDLEARVLAQLEAGIPFWPQKISTD